MSVCLKFWICYIILIIFDYTNNQYNQSNGNQYNKHDGKECSSLQQQVYWCIRPQKLYKRSDNEFRFALDVATTEDKPLKIPIYFTKEDNALSKDWHHIVVDSQWVRRNAVYVNPPYTSRNIAEWIKKAREESVKHGITIVMLLPSRTDTRWFHDYMYRKPNVEHRFIRGRLKFKVDTSIRLSQTQIHSQVW